LSAALRQALAARDVQESFARQGATTTPGTPEALRAQIADEVKRWAAVVKEAGVKAE
jgi:tripartite-type tricarboxylate transporter receptor subunit TctC